MGVNYFTVAQVSELKDNPFVIKVSQKAITYEEGFKDIFIKKYNEGLNPTQIFRDAGFDTSVIGQKRISNFDSRTRKQAQRIEGFKDTRKDNLGRPRTKELTQDEEIEQLKHRNDILKQENDFLKRVKFINKKQVSKQSKTKHQKKNSN